MDGGPAYGNVQLTGALQGGSGAGGGANDPDNEEGAGGGGSGGTVYLVAAVLRIEGTVSATGGLGGLDDYTYTGQANRECCNNGGPGSVGRIRLDYRAPPSAALSHRPPATFLRRRERLYSVLSATPAYDPQVFMFLMKCDVFTQMCEVRPP